MITTKYGKMAFFLRFYSYGSNLICSLSALLVIYCIEFQVITLCNKLIEAFRCLTILKYWFIDGTTETKNLYSDYIFFR